MQKKKTHLTVIYWSIRTSVLTLSPYISNIFINMQHPTQCFPLTHLTWLALTTSSILLVFCLTYPISPWLTLTHLAVSSLNLPCRSSETVKLIDLLDAAKDRMRDSLQARADEGKCPLKVCVSVCPCTFPSSSIYLCVLSHFYLPRVLCCYFIYHDNVCVVRVCSILWQSFLSVLSILSLLCLCLCLRVYYFLWYSV